jgi:hypothetical protein
MRFGSPRSPLLPPYPVSPTGKGAAALHPTTNKKGEYPMTEATKLTKADLLQFTGSETWYRHGLVRTVLFTDGAKYVADKGEAYWLLDEIALAQRYKKAVAREEFQLWRLTVKGNNTAALVCEDGNGKRVYSKRIEYTDFPLECIELYYTNNTILLPSEY